MLVPVLSGHSAQTPKASSSPAFDLQCRKSIQGKFVPLMQPLPSFWLAGRDALSHHTGGRPCPFLSVPGGLFQLATLAPSYIPGTMRTSRLTRSKALGHGEAAGRGICDTQLLCTSNPPPAPFQLHCRYWPLSTRGCLEGAGAEQRVPGLATPAQHLMG